MPSLLTIEPLPDSPWLVKAIPSAYSEAVRQQMRGMPGIAWKADRSSSNGRGYFVGPREALEIVTETLTAARVVRLRGSPEILRREILPHSLPNLPNLELRDYQISGVAWASDLLRSDGSAILADEMGIGKTPQAIAIAEEVCKGRKLVIAPAIVIRHWEDRISRWSPRPELWRVISFDRFKTAAKGGSKRVPPLEDGISFLVIDEGHYLSNPKSQRSKAVASWISGLPERPLVLMLSGTPMTARPRDLYSPLELLFPGRFGSFFDFSKRYCDGHWEEIPNTENRYWDSSGSSREEELSRRLRAIMLRRTKHEVALEIPSKTRTVIEVEIPSKARKDLQKAYEAVNWNGNLKSSISSLLTNVEGYKITAAKDLAEEILSAGGRCLILTLRKETARELAAHFQVSPVTGEILPSRRQEILSSREIGIATLFSVTTGIDLVDFDHVIFTGLDWVPSTILQGEARAHRIGQSKPVTIYYLVGMGTVDEVVRERVIERLDQFVAITGSKEGEESSFSEDLTGSEEELIAGIAEALRAA